MNRSDMNMFPTVLFGIIVINFSLAVANVTFSLAGWTMNPAEFQQMLIYANVIMIMAGFLVWIFERYYT